MSAVLQSAVGIDTAPAERKLLPFGPKARSFASTLPRDDARITLLEGAIRSAKTWAMIPKIIALCTYQVAGLKVFAGVSKQTIHDNVLSDLFDLFGEGNYHYNRQSGELNLMGSEWHVIGAKDEGSEKYLRGKTIGVVVGDELTLWAVNFIKMLLNRMSPHGARAYFTTNPDTPFHYVYTDLMHNADLIAARSIKVYHFSIEDNPNITGLSDYTPEGRAANDAYRAHLNHLYKGVYHDRFIKGRWVVAEGGIYQHVWNENCQYDDVPWTMENGQPGRITPEGLRRETGHAERYVPMDCGTDHPQVYGDMIDDGDTIWLDREYVWDSRIELRQKTDRQYRQDLEQFLLTAPDAQVIIPPECASFRAECVQAGIWLTDADNEVLDGLRMTASMFGMGKLMVHRTNCPRTCKGLSAHVWDPKAAARGVEQPLKQNDDEADMVRYGIKTKVAPWRLALPD